MRLYQNTLLPTKHKLYNDSYFVWSILILLPYNSNSNGSFTYTIVSLLNLTIILHSYNYIQCIHQLIEAERVWLI